MSFLTIPKIMELNTVRAYIVASTITHVLGGSIGGPKGCEINQFKELGQCIECTTCGPGYKADKGCGYGSGSLAQCMPCERGTFQDLSGRIIEYCEPWINCMHYFRSTIFNGTSQKNAVCGECIQGHYFNKGLNSGYDDGSHTYSPCSHIDTTAQPDGLVVEVAMVSVASPGLVALMSVTSIVVILAVVGLFWYICQTRQSLYDTNSANNLELNKPGVEVENLLAGCVMCRTDSGNSLGVNCDCDRVRQNDPDTVNVTLDDPDTPDDPDTVVAVNATPDDSDTVVAVNATPDDHDTVVAVNATLDDHDRTIAIHVDSNDAAFGIGDSQSRAIFIFD